MKILQVHNAYRMPGGEDQVVAAERELLEAHGHEVRLFSADNDEIGNLWSRLVTAWRAPFNPTVRRRLTRILDQWRPDIVHVHNFFPLLTPSVFDSCQDSNVPVILTLHNFRLVCPGAFLYCKGKICEDCLKGHPYRAVLHRCYRGSFIGSLAVARMVDFHRRRGTWRTKVDRFIVMSEFAKNKMVEEEWDPGRIIVKSHFTTLPAGRESAVERSGFLFAGRLSPEKGVSTLLQGWSGLNFPLSIAGEGPLRNEVEQCGNSQIRLLGWLSPEEMSAQFLQAACLVVPSEWYETFGMVVIEAFAHGLPVIASRIGALAEIIEDGVTGMLFEPGNAIDLNEKVIWMQEHPQDCLQMGQNARLVYENRYTPVRNSQLLMNIYQGLIDEKKKNYQPGH
ncbi:MAG: glycosyltransferase [Desulfuromonadales bacterium]